MIYLLIMMLGSDETKIRWGVRQLSYLQVRTLLMRCKYLPKGQLLPARGEQELRAELLNELLRSKLGVFDAMFHFTLDGWFASRHQHGCESLFMDQFDVGRDGYCTSGPRFYVWRTYLYVSRFCRGPHVCMDRYY